MSNEDTLGMSHQETVLWLIENGFVTREQMEYLWGKQFFDDAT